jgi:hypothetical protein
MPVDHLLLAVFAFIFLGVIILTALVARVHAVLTGVDAPLLFPIHLPESVQSSGWMMLFVHLIQLMTAFVARVGLLGAQLHFMVLMTLATKNLAHLNSVLCTLQREKFKL